MRLIGRALVLALVVSVTATPAYAQGKPVTNPTPPGGSGGSLSIEMDLSTPSSAISLDAEASGTIGPNPTLDNCEFDLEILGEDVLTDCPLP